MLMFNENPTKGRDNKIDIFELVLQRQNQKLFKIPEKIVH